MNNLILLNGESDHKILPLVFYVNGKKTTDYSPDPELTLLRYLREKLRLCGTKLGCGEGGCGACTVMISKTDRQTNEVKHLAVNACLTPICSVHGMAVTTIEGIGSTKTKLHPVQERIAKAHGSQCGFCTPGIVMSMYALLRSSPKPTMKEMEVAFQGNLCRCTGYRPIIEGYRTFTQEYQQSANDCAMGEKCCKVNGNSCGVEVDDKLFEPSEFTPLDPSQEPIFPPALKISDQLDKISLIFKGPRVTWYRPTSLNELLTIKNNYPHARIVVGNTEVGVEVKLKNLYYPVLVNPDQIKEMTKIIDVGYGLRVGASTSLIDLEQALRQQIEKLPEEETRLYRAISEMLHYFAGKQIRNVASIGGNIMTASPISDLNPIFTAAGIELEIKSLTNGVRNVRMGNDFFISYRTHIIDHDEVLLSVLIPKTTKDQHFFAFKQAKRRDDDIAIVNIAVNVFFQPNTDIVQDLQLVFGGVAATTVMAPKTSAIAVGKKWDTNLVEEVNRALIEELPLSPSAPGGMILYRRSLTLSLFFKAFLSISQSLEQDIVGRVPVPINERSGAEQFHTLIPKSAQLYQKAPGKQSPMDPVGRPHVHYSAYKQATGEAVYCDDMPKFENELYLAYVLSTKAHAKVISIDAAEALSEVGVQAFFSSTDIAADRNKIGSALRDEEVFISDIVTSQGQILGAIVGDNQIIAQRAAKKVKIVYEDLSPVIITLEDAITKKSFFPNCPLVLKAGDVEGAFREADHIVEGECRLGGQQHFYMETQVAVAVPRDNDELEVYSATQQPTQIQLDLARILGIQANKITCKVKRVGGSFGGKETRSSFIAIPVAIAAHKLGRPVRCALDRDEDMIMIGGRHPFYFKYKISFTKDGKWTGCDIQIYNNGGHSLDLSLSVLRVAMFSFVNAYFVPNVFVQGWVCRTNLPSNTAFRGFGNPQGMLVAEHIIRDIARTIGKDYIEIATLNMMESGYRTHYTQVIENCNVLRCWQECLQSSCFTERRKSIELFNKQNRWRKRGISIVPILYGVGMIPKFLNQAGALVHVYSDGSVLLNHGGIEMGQGLHTKMIQVTANALNIPFDKIHNSETATDKIPNTTATAGSLGSDLNGMAVLNACKVIVERLAPYKEKYPTEGWDSWVNKAYFDRVQLSATGFYSVVNIDYDIETGLGNPYCYYTYGAGCSEVEIDCLTGDHQVIRTDIVMDLGSSINPAIDIGQIEGAFMQGYGLYTLEEMVYSPAGTIHSKGSSVYKIPVFADIPGEFNVSLLTGTPNPRAVFSSKAVGEPPLFSASSVFFAIKEAISAARRDENIDPHFNLVSPATVARIRMACQDGFTRKFKETEAGSFVPWDVMP